MIRKHVEPNSWYGDNTLEGDNVSLIRDSHILRNGDRVELPVGSLGKENVLFLTCLRYKGQVLLAGQGQIGDKGSGNWLYRDGRWKIVSPSFATYPCAFSTSYLYLVVGPNQYRILDLESDVIGPVIAKAIGVNGIRYIDFAQSFDGIVTGDSTYGPDGYNLSQYTRRDEIVIGQSYVEGAVALFGKRYLLESGDTQFIRFRRAGNRICCAIVKMLEQSTVFYWMNVEDLLSFPIEGSVVLPNNPPSDPIEPKKDNMPQASNQFETVKRMIRLHPEIDTMDENTRGKILDYVCNALGGKPWGRKARNADGSNKNTDGLTYLRTDGQFEIYDVISGGNGSATWDYAGIFAQGANGYWATGEPVNGLPPAPAPSPKPTESTVVKVFTPRVPYNEMSAFVAKVNLAHKDTVFGRSNPVIAGRDLMPTQTVAHLLYRYYFEHENHSDDQLIQETKDRGNAG